MTSPEAQETTPITLETRVTEVLRQGLAVDLDPSTDVIDAGLLDSLRFVEILVALEAAFEIEVDVEDLEVKDFRSARAIAQFLGRRFGIT